MRQRAVTAAVMGIMIVLALASCKKDKTPTNSNPSQIPSDVARITGSVHDAAGNPVSDVFLHIVYPQAVPAMKTAEPMVPTSAFFYDTAQVLYTECGGTEPLPDGVMVKIFWDSNANGPGDDQPPPLCDSPPDCRTGPAFSVNMIEFPINGVARGMGAGLFEAPRYFHTLGDMLTPNRFYLCIFCADGRPLYTSNVMDLPGGPSMNLVHFNNCTPCTGAPVVPQWILNASYPNPAVDSLTLNFGLLEAADALVTLRGSARGRVDTLVHQMLPSGPRLQRVALRNATAGTIANGLYAVRFQAGPFDQQHDILKNDTSVAHLQNTEAATTTTGNGSFILDAPAGISLVHRNDHGDSLGTLSLARVRVVAIRVGFAVQDTTFDINGGQGYDVNLVLREP